MTIAQFDPVPANNATAITGANLAEGEPPSAINDAIRQICADIAVWYAAVDPAGRIEQYGGASAPTGWLECDGLAVSRATYARLFTAVSTTWGAGDGSTTFNVPDFRGRTLIGKGTGSGLTARTLAATGGEENHTLTIAETPAHNHPGSTASGNQGGEGAETLPNTLSLTTAAVQTTVTVTSQGGGGSHNNLQPFAVTMFIIRT